MVSLPLGTSVTVFVAVVNGAMRHVPFSAPPAAVISIQCPPK